MRDTEQGRMHAGEEAEAGGTLGAELDAALRSQGHTLRGTPSGDGGATDRTITALRTRDRETIAMLPPAGFGASGRALAAAACVALLAGAVFIAKIDGRSREATPSASVVLSNTLRGFPRQPQDVMRIASTPLRKEAQKLAAGSKRMFGGLELFGRHSTER